MEKTKAKEIVESQDVSLCCNAFLYWELYSKEVDKYVSTCSKCGCTFQGQW